MKYFAGRLLSSFVLLTLLFVGCQQDEAAMSVTETLQNDGRFGTLSSLLGEGDLQSLQSGSFTVFAPTDRRSRHFTKR